MSGDQIPVQEGSESAQEASAATPTGAPQAGSAGSKALPMSGLRVLDLAALRTSVTPA